MNVYDIKLGRLLRNGNKTVITQTRSVTILRYATVVILALSIVGAATTVFGGPDDREPEPEVERDLDMDGLCDVCEDEMFGTNRELADTDGDGVPDGDEDHDRDGLSNLEEFNLTVALMDAVVIGDTEKVMTLLEYSPYMYILGGTPLIGAS